MSRPLVTVAVPTVSRPKMLRETLESVLAQRWPALDILVSDNGADPGTVAVVEALRDPRLRYRRNDATVPATIHFNQCLAEARGEYFVILSDDDVVSENFVEALATAMERHPGAAVGLPRSETMDEAGATQAALKAPAWDERSGIDFLLDWLWRRGPIPVSTFISAFWRTSALRAAGGFPEFADGSNSENGSIISVACRGSVCFARDALFRYRVYPTSCGLSVPPERLALSAAQFRRHVEEDATTRAVLAALPAAQRSAVLRGVRRMLARQYLLRLETNYLPRIGLGGVLAAVPGYGADGEYLKALPRFLGRIAARALRGARGGSQR
jgi:glycosyltransferase involved in cell wall biosynthesis